MSVWNIFVYVEQNKGNKIILNKKEIKKMDLLNEDFNLLKEKIEQTKKMFPWYSNYCGPTDEIKSIKDLPLMGQELLEKHYYSKLDDSSYSVYMTSGTSNESRKKVYYSKKDDDEYIRIKSEIYKKILSDLNGHIKAFADMGTGHAASTARIVFEQLGCETRSISFELDIKEHIGMLSEFKPDVLYTMPSILDSIIAHTDNVKTFGIKKIILVGEIASKEWIAKIAKNFGILSSQIYDTYGSIEIGTLAYYSHEHSKYILAEGLFAEGLLPEEINDNYEELRENERIIVLTSLVRDTFPALRFVTFDVVRDLQTEIIDGKKVQTFTSIVKRIGNEIKHGEKISIYDIENVVYKYLDIAEVRVRVIDNHLTVYIQSPELNDENIVLIRNEIQNAIPEIGTMIKNHILDEINVISGDIDNGFKRKIKNKNII